MTELAGAAATGAGGSAVDAAEIAKFDAVAAEWWDPKGKFAPLHKMQPTRLRYLRDQIAGQFGRDPGRPRPFEGLRIADIGCGGGLLCEPMARLGATVTGVDASHRAVLAAEAHAAQMGLEIAYRCATVEDLAEKAAAEGEGEGEDAVSGAQGRQGYDVVLALEILEHVPDPAAFLAACGRCVRPGGLLIVSTLNRNAQSFLGAIVAAEYVLGWLPRGTHDWRRFLTPEELAAKIEAAGLRVVDRKGMVYDPLGDAFSLSDRDLSVNYAMTAEKPG